MAYTPRLNSNGMSGNLHWYSNGNPYQATGFGMPNCTAYAWGRFWEISDPNNDGSHIPNPNNLPGYWSGNYWWREVNKSVYKVGQEPKLGAVICFWDSQNIYGGHVAVVEVINNGGESIITSNSAYGSTYFYTQTLYRSNNYCWYGSNGHFYQTQGFIYNPYADNPEPTPTPTPSGRREGKFPWVLYANKIRDRQSLTKFE